jgi:hypothetical protein
MQPNKYELVINRSSQVGLNIPSPLLSRVDRIGLFAAVHESGIGTFRTSRDV